MQGHAAMLVVMCSMLSQAMCGMDVKLPHVIVMSCHSPAVTGGDVEYAEPCHNAGCDVYHVVPSHV